MPKIGRNEACPCGSGKKYKRCCWQGENSVSTPRPPSALAGLMKVLRVVAESPGFDDDDDLFMELTNGVIELVHAKRLDEAQQMCERLRDEFPECVDWLDRSAIVAEARGDLLAASDFYRRAAEFAAAHKLTPLQRSSTPEDIAGAVRFLLEAPAVTGHTLLVDGGQHLLGQPRDVLFLAQQQLAAQAPIPKD